MSRPDIPFLPSSSALFTTSKHASPSPLFHIVGLSHSSSFYHVKSCIAIAYTYGIIEIEHLKLTDLVFVACQKLLPVETLAHRPPKDRVRVILLLLLLRRLGGLILELLDRLLRVVLVAAVGLDLFYRLALAKDASFFELRVSAHSVKHARQTDSNLQHSRCH